MTTSKTQQEKLKNSLKILESNLKDELDFLDELRRYGWSEESFPVWQCYERIKDIRNEIIDIEK